MRIHWHVAELLGRRVLHLGWIEHDGPPAVAPTRKGFGSRLIKRSLNPAHNGAVSFDYRASGLVCHIAAPLAGSEEA